MGGAQQLVYEIARRMHQSNRDVVIFTGLSDPKKSLSALDNKILEAVFREKISVEVIPSLNDKISLISDLKSLYMICKLLRKHKPSVVHIHSSKTGILARLACKLLNVKKVIYHVHGWSFSRARGAVRMFYIFLEKLFYYLTDKYIFVCKQDMIDFISCGGNTQIKIKSYIIYPGAEFLRLDKQEKFRTELRKKLGYSYSDHVVGTVGRLDFQKNPQIFVEIASSYSKIDSEAKFLWIGKGDYKEDLKNHIDQLGISDRFLLPGYIEEVEPYFSVFDTFVITSRYEGLPVTILKALACGIPVVGFNINGINDLSKKFSLVNGVEPYSIEEFATKLINAKNMKKSRNKIIKKETEYVRENFNLDRMYDNILKVYDSV
tara:strand:- start:278 stop:1405 length:1128 start_codon:yes stop_codon:yes gene_type:complete